MSAVGAVLYAKDLERVAGFYQGALGLKLAGHGDGFAMLETDAFTLTVVRIPEEVAAAIAIESPPVRREETPIKLSFPSANLEAARAAIEREGGCLDPDTRAWTFGGMRLLDGIDPEGNVFQLRQSVDS